MFGAASELLHFHLPHSLLVVKAHMTSHSAASLLQIPQAIMVLLDPELQQDRLYSKNLLSWRLVTTTAGYFAYDLYVHTARFEFLPSLVHAGAALTVFLSGIYCGILHYYGAHPSLIHCPSLVRNVKALEELLRWASARSVLYSLWCISSSVRLEGPRSIHLVTQPGGLACSNPQACCLQQARPVGWMQRRRCMQEPPFLTFPLLTLYTACCRRPVPAVGVQYALCVRALGAPRAGASRHQAVPVQRPHHDGRLLYLSECDGSR